MNIKNILLGLLLICSGCAAAQSDSSSQKRFRHNVAAVMNTTADATLLYAAIAYTDYAIDLQNKGQYLADPSLQTRFSVALFFGSTLKLTALIIKLRAINEDPNTESPE